MSLFREIPPVVEATVWWMNGDHPGDGVGEILVDQLYPNDRSRDYARLEGKVVRFFRSPEQEHSGFLTHEVCGRTWHDHGWIDRGDDAPGDWVNVCPGDWVVPDGPGLYRRVDSATFAATHERVDPA